MLVLCMGRHPRLGQNSPLSLLDGDVWGLIRKNFVSCPNDFEKLTNVYQTLAAKGKMTYQFKITIGNLDHAIGMKEMDVLEQQIFMLECEMSKRVRYANMTLERFMEELRLEQEEYENDCCESGLE